MVIKSKQSSILSFYRRDKMTSYNNFQNTYTLTPHSPLIHFQWDSDHAALRATEVKPKLDRYIVKHYGKIPERWKKDDINGKISLNYKMRIVTDENNEHIDLGRNTPYDIFYGNMGKKGVMNKSTLTITCFHKDLLKYIDEIIGDFFIVTNFGTMQSKGFGSFTVDKKSIDYKYICDILKIEYTNEGHCYTFRTNSRFTFKNIKTIYSLIKSGLNFTNDNDNKKNADSDPNIPLKGKKIIKEVVTITEQPEGNDEKGKKAKKIERLNSPILFKVINNVVYFVGCEPNESIYGKTFSFSSTLGHNTLTVPEKNDLPQDFMNSFMHYAFLKLQDCKNKPRFNLNHITIKEV